MIKFKDHKEFEFAFRNNGVLADQTDAKQGEIVRVHMQDALSHPDSTAYFPTVVENYVREAIEPVLIGAKILNRINYKSGQVITLPSVGAMTAADIPEGAEYPEKSVNIGPGAQITTIGKSGLAVKVSEECLRYSQYDVLSLNLRAAGRALARHKEQKIWDMVSRTGVVTHDNVHPEASVYGATSGRSYSGAGNGAITMDNFYEAYGTVLMNGFTPNAIIVHPLTFTMFLTDPVMRTFALMSGNMSQWFNGWTGNAQNQYPWGRGIMGAMGPGPERISDVGATPDVTQFQGISAAPKLPDYLGLNLSIIVSPYVPYNHQTKLTDIFVVDTNNIGALIVDEEVIMDEIPDKLRDLKKIKLRERYAIAHLNEGNAAAVMKNVRVTANELILPAIARGPEGLLALDRAAALYNSAGQIVGG